MQRISALATALLAVALLAACVTSGSTPPPDPSIDATTLDLSGTWKVRGDYTRYSHVWRGTLELERDGDAYTGVMRWSRTVYDAEQSVRCTVTRDKVVVQGQNILKWNGGGVYYPDTLTLAPASPTLLVGHTGDTGANSGSAKIWREE